MVGNPHFVGEKDHHQRYNGVPEEEKLIVQLEVNVPDCCYHNLNQDDRAGDCDEKKEEEGIETVGDEALVGVDDDEEDAGQLNEVYYLEQYSHYRLLYHNLFD